MTPLIELRDVEFAYPHPERGPGRGFALGPLSFTVEAGEIFGIIGPNSAGKTTLLRLLTRVLAPSAGDVRLAGQPIARLPRAAVARDVAVVPQEAPRPFPFTVEQLVLMGRYPHAPGRFFETGEDLAIAREAMTATGVLALARLPLEQLSGGERQRAMLARALAQQPRLMVLDEPTSHLDLRYQAETAALLRRVRAGRRMTVLIVSHDLDLAGEICDRLLLLGEGRALRLGVPGDVLARGALEAAFGCPVTVAPDPATGRPTVRIRWSDAAAAADGRG